jgi:hypothetical protein
MDWAETNGAVLRHELSGTGHMPLLFIHATRDERMAQPDHTSPGRCASLRGDTGARHGARGPVADVDDPAYRAMWQRPEIRPKTSCRVGVKADTTCAVATERAP